MNRSSQCLVEAVCTNQGPISESSRTRKKTILERLVKTLTIWSEHSKQRKELKLLAEDPDLLLDLGLSYYDVHREARKIFWRK